MSVSVNVRVDSRAQIERWRAAARRSMRSSSSWIRIALNRAAEETEAEAAMGDVLVRTAGQSVQFNIRAESQAQVERWRKAAARVKRSLSDWIRLTLDRAARVTE